MSVFTNPASGSKGHADAYVAAILDLLGTRDPRAVLGETVTALRAAVAGLDNAALAAPEAPGKWSIQQVLAHLADSDIVWAYRVRMILAHDRPTLTGYDQDLWADRLRYDRTPAASSLDTLAAVRAANLALLDRMPPDALNRVGLHAERGEESVAHLMRLYAGHDLLHLAQTARLRKTLTR
jgi:uncharacterized damage-inducible protein DinB